MLKAMVRFRLGWRHAVEEGECPFHIHPFTEIVFHYRGSGIVTPRKGKPMRFSPGSVTLCPAGRPHKQINAEAGEDIIILVEDPSGLLRSPLRNLPVPLDDHVRREMLSLAAQTKGSGPLRQAANDHRATAIALLLRHDMRSRFAAERLRPDEEHARRAMEYIENSFENIRAVGDVAAAVGLSQDYLRHVFARRYGRGVKSLLVEKRIEKAGRLLAQTSFSVKEVSAMCGYANDRYFSADFRRASGCPPGQFRSAIALRKGA